MATLEELIVDLKETLQRQIAGLDQRMDSFEHRMDVFERRMDGVEQQNRNLEHLVVQFKESLEREMREGFAQIHIRLDNQDSRLQRQGGLLQTGARWTVRMTSWSERVDAALAVKDHQIQELQERLRKLENGSKSQG